MTSFQFKGTLTMSSEEINIGSLVRTLKEEKLEGQVLRNILEDLQEALTTRLCGRRYGRSMEAYNYRRAGKRMRTVITKAGRVQFRLQKITDLRTGRVSTPFLKKLGVGRRERCTRDIKKACIDLITRLSYRDTSNSIKDTLSIKVSKSRVHDFVREIAPVIEAANQVNVMMDRVECITADGTKTHGLNGKKNEVNVVIGFDPRTNKKKLLKAHVNKNWGKTGREVKDMKVVDEDAVLVSDAEKAVRYALLEKDMQYQMCVRHAINDVSYKMWHEGMPLEERKGIQKETSKILYTLKNSTDRHIQDGNHRRLECRINWALKELKRVARCLRDDGYRKVWKFIQNSGNHLVTYAKLAMKGMRIPHTSNLIERLMGEIAKRVKNKWAHWSTNGLENLLNILLVRYTSKDTYKKFWEDYVYQNKIIKAQLIINREVSEF